MDAYRTGQYEQAKQSFLRAYSLRAEPTLLYNLARTFEKLGERTTARVLPRAARRVAHAAAG